MLFPLPGNVHDKLILLVDLRVFGNSDEAADDPFP